MACLDTNVLIDLQGRSGKAVAGRAGRALRRLVTQDESLVTTRFNVAELWVGVERSADRRGEQAKVERLLSGLAILEFDEPAARLFGTITARFQKAGRPVGDMDLLIACVAITAGHLLVTRNARHFAEIPGLLVATY